MAVTRLDAPVVPAPARNGTGLIATRPLRPGETILRVEGQVVHYELLWRREGSRFSANCYRYGPDTYLDPGTGPGRYVNHSCRPNAGVRKLGNRILLFAARRIAARSEVTIDYSTTIGDDDIWTMRCNCGYECCRRTIRNFGSLPEAQKRRYLAAGLVPDYIIRTLTAQDRRFLAGSG
jgi:uncharacterized protein